jgi:hypothetical protein
MKTKQQITKKDLKEETKKVGDQCKNSKTSLNKFDVATISLSIYNDKIREVNVRGKYLNDPYTQKTIFARLIDGISTVVL